MDTSNVFVKNNPSLNGPNFSYHNNNEMLSSAFAEYVTVFTVLQAYSTPAGQASGEKFSLPIKVAIYLPWKDERFGMPWRSLNSQHYDYKRIALPTELSRHTIKAVFIQILYYPNFIWYPAHNLIIEKSTLSESINWELFVRIPKDIRELSNILGIPYIL